MKIVRSRYLPWRGFDAINLFGVLFVHQGVYLSGELLNHERIHTAQMRELGFIFFYIIYFIEWTVRLAMRGRAYRGISFEREAYDNQRDLEYLSHRRHYAWLHHMRRKNTRHKKQHKKNRHFKKI
ncbi:MAG: hypothetical protein II786_05505 [Muribaculaceae bacterium]|nr:hypothetical protein [Muribaculaceae bacterium]MBR3100725.1 hypothetical protein [Muribaculaceae bacterium]